MEEDRPASDVWTGMMAVGACKQDETAGKLTWIADLWRRRAMVGGKRQRCKDKVGPVSK